MLLFTPLFNTIDHFKERDYETVTSVATDLLNSSPESNQELIKQSNETITLFSFANNDIISINLLSKCTLVI